MAARAGKSLLGERGAPSPAQPHGSWSPVPASPQQARSLSLCPAEASRAAVSSKCRYPPTLTMVTEAVGALNERKGSSTAAIKRYIRHNYPGVDPIRLKYYLRKALLKGLEKGYLVRPLSSSAQGATGRFKVGGRPDPRTRSQRAPFTRCRGASLPKTRGPPSPSHSPRGLCPGAPVASWGDPRGSLRPLPSWLANGQRETPGLDSCGSMPASPAWAWQSPTATAKALERQAGGAASVHLSAPLEILPVAPILQLAAVKPKRSQPAQGEGPPPKPEKKKKKKKAEGKARAESPKGKGKGKGSPPPAPAASARGLERTKGCHCQKLHRWAWQGGS